MNHFIKKLIIWLEFDEKNPSNETLSADLTIIKYDQFLSVNINLKNVA